MKNYKLENVYRRKKVSNKGKFAMFLIFKPKKIKWNFCDTKFRFDDEYRTNLIDTFY